MSPKDFVTYLNGAVELGNINALNSTNFSVVNEKLNVVKNEGTPEGVFCTWLKGFMEAAENPELSASQFSKVSVKLFEIVKNQSVFDKEVDTKPPISKLPTAINSDMQMRC